MTSVASAMACFSEISLARVFEEERTSIAVSSSRMFPSDEESTSRILSSISFSCLDREKNVEIVMSLINILGLTL